MVGLIKSTLAEQAYAALRDLIVGGQFPAGQRLMPEELAQTLSISPTPVKEALTRLQLDGLVDATSRRGMMVRTFTASDVFEVYHARLMIESDAIRRGLQAGRVNDRFIADLAACAAMFETRPRPASSHELLAALHHDLTLHALLAGLGENARIVAWHEQVLRQTQTVRVWSPDTYAFELACEEHAAIVDALRSRDERACLRALDQHLERSSRDLMATLSESEPAAMSPVGQSFISDRGGRTATQA